MPAPFIEVFVNKLREEAGISLTEEQYDNISNAQSLEAAQRIAMELYGADVESVRTVVEAMGEDIGQTLTFTAPTTIGGRDPGATYLDAQMQPINVAGETVEGVDLPDQSVLDEYGMTAEEWVSLDPAIREQIINAQTLLTASDEDTREYLGLFGEDPRGYTEIVSAPGYTWTYGEGLNAPSTAYMRSHTAENPTMYSDGDEVAKWSGYSPAVRDAFTKKMIEAGMISKEDAETLTVGSLGRSISPGVGDLGQGYSGTSRIQIEAFKEALATANYLGTTPMSAIFARGETAKAKGPGGGGGGRLPFSVPAALRTIPDYETLQQRVKEMLRQSMGRDAEGWEMNLLADEMQSQHKTYNTQMIEAARAAYNRGQHTVDIEVPDPAARTRKFFEETYSGELDRRRDVGEASATNMLMMNALTMGGGMVG